MQVACLARALSLRWVGSCEPDGARCFSYILSPCRVSVAMGRAPDKEPSPANANDSEAAAHTVAAAYAKAHY
jgi:hypothetical protein